jgi:hypothetical protein
MRYATRNTIRVIVLALVFICGVAFCAQAADEIFSGKVERITAKTTKTGDTYQIVFIKETKELEGVSYTVDTPMYAFGSPGESAKNLKPGDQFKAVVNKSERGGNTRYSILGFAK